MRPITKQQQKLLGVVRSNPGLTTHGLAVLCGHRQTYETFLRNRLDTLRVRGLIRSEERYSSCHCIARKWYVTNEGKGE